MGIPWDIYWHIICATEARFWDTIDGILPLFSAIFQVSNFVYLLFWGCYIVYYIYIYTHILLSGLIRVTPSKNMSYSYGWMTENGGWLPTCSLVTGRLCWLNLFATFTGVYSSTQRNNMKQAWSFCGSLVIHMRRNVWVMILSASQHVSTCLNMSQNVSTGSYRFLRAIQVIQEKGPIRDDGPRERLRPARRSKVLVYRDDLT